MLNNTALLTLVILITKLLTGILFIVYILGNGPISVSLFEGSISFYGSIILAGTILLIFTGIELSKLNLREKSNDNNKILLLSLFEIASLFILLNGLFVIIIFFISMIPAGLLSLVWLGDSQTPHNFFLLITYITPTLLVIVFSSIFIQNILSKGNNINT